MVGHRGIYVDGWKAVTRHLQGVPYDDDMWELYHVAEDFSECHDLAAEMPDKLRRDDRRAGGPRPRSTASCRSTTG